MHLTASCDGCSYSIVKISKRSSRSTSDEDTFGSHRRLRAHPDDVIYVHIVSVKTLVCCVQVKDRSEARLIYSPIVEKVAVLTELVVIAAVVGRGIHIAEEHSDAVRSLSRHPLNESAAPVCIYF